MRFEVPDTPRWWNVLGCLCAVVGVGFWIAVVVVAWHFIAKGR